MFELIGFLTVVALGVGIAAGIEVLNDNDDEMSAPEPETFGPEDDSIIDTPFRGTLEDALDALVAEGEFTQAEADEALAEINFRSGAVNLATGAGDDGLLLGDGDDRVDTGEGEDTVFAGPGDDVVRLGLDNDVYGDGDRSFDVDDDILTFPGVEDVFEGVATFEESSFEGGDDEVLGGPGSDLISDSYGANFVNGQQGADLIDTVDALDDALTPDRVKGGFGYDTLVVDQGDRVETGRGLDTVIVDVEAGVSEDYSVVTIDDFEKGVDVLVIEGEAALLVGDAGTPNPITVTPDEEGTGTIVAINGIPVIRAVGEADLTVDDVVVRLTSTQAITAFGATGSVMSSGFTETTGG